MRWCLALCGQISRLAERGIDRGANRASQRQLQVWECDGASQSYAYETPQRRAGEELSNTMNGRWETVTRPREQRAVHSARKRGHTDSEDARARQNALNSTSPSPC